MTTVVFDSRNFDQHNLKGLTVVFDGDFSSPAPDATPHTAETVEEVPNESGESNESDEREEVLPKAPAIPSEGKFKTRYAGPRILVGKTLSVGRWRTACSHRGCTHRAQSGNPLYPKNCLLHLGGKRCSVANCSKSANGSTSTCVFHGGGNRCVVSHMHRGVAVSPFGPKKLGPAPKDMRGTVYTQYAGGFACQLCFKEFSN